jgi:hypothetical protein
MTTTDMFHVGAISGEYTCPTCKTEFGIEPWHIDTCAWCGDDQCPSCESEKCVGEGCHARICEECQHDRSAIDRNEECALCPRCAEPVVERELKTVFVKGVAA